MAKKIEPKFTEPQAWAVRVGLEQAAESSDGQMVRLAENAMRELDRAQREAGN